MICIHRDTICKEAVPVKASLRPIEQNTQDPCPSCASSHANDSTSVSNAPERQDFSRRGLPPPPKSPSRDASSRPVPQALLFQKFPTLLSLTLSDCILKDTFI